jgi:hypothetical protein
MLATPTVNITSHERVGAVNTEQYDGISLYEYHGQYEHHHLTGGA